MNDVYIPSRHICARSAQLLGPIGEATLQDLGLGSELRGPQHELVTVDPHLPTLLAFDHMLAKGVSGAPVVDAHGEMVANLSVSDLK